MFRLLKINIAATVDFMGRIVLILSMVVRISPGKIHCHFNTFKGHSGGDIP